MHLFIPLILQACLASVLSSGITADTGTPDASYSTTTIHSILEGKHESLSLCPFVVLEPDEFELFPNGTIHVSAYNLTLDKSYHILSEGGTVRICVPFDATSSVEKDHLEPSWYLTVAGVSLSMVSLLVHLLVFCVVPDMRNLPGWNLASLCASLLFGYLLLCVIGSGGHVAQHSGACVAVASLAHFFLLASVLWMSVMSYDVCTSLLRATGSLRMSSTDFSRKRYALYCLCSFGTALVFAASALLADMLPGGVPEGYRPDFAGESDDLCWFRQKTALLVFFAGPVLALTCLNLALFGISACTLHFNKMKQSEDHNKTSSILRRRYMMYFRLSVITGVTWTSGIVATVADVDWAWYVFVLLNTLQGFFIFVAFTCNRKVRAYFREKLFRRRRGSEQTLAPTFQSYCFYANSIEKDMDKIVEVSNEKTNSIVIHL